MATFLRETAIVQEPHLRRLLAGDREKLVRLPFNLVRYDDNNQYVEPLNYSIGSFQWADNNPEVTNVSMLVVDVPPFSGVTEIR